MRVIFDKVLKSGTNLIEYPDNRSLFSNSEVVDGRIIADYAGAMILEEYIVDAQSLKLKEVREKYSNLYDNSLKDYSTNEQATFPKQETEYEAWALDNTIPTPTVDRLAVARKVDRVILLEKIGANIIIRDTMTGEQQAMEDAIKVCKTQYDLDQIVV